MQPNATLNTAKTTQSEAHSQPQESQLDATHVANAASDKRVENTCPQVEIETSTRRRASHQQQQQQQQQQHVDGDEDGEEDEDEEFYDMQDDDLFIERSSPTAPSGTHGGDNLSPRSEDGDDPMEMNAREQELLVNIQELQRQLSMVHIQTEKPPEEIVPPLNDSPHRLIMVSNRLPISMAKNDATGEWTFTMSSGGLVTALNGIRDEMPFIWIGWLGEEIAHEEQTKVREKLAKEFNCVPVFLSKEVASRYYNDFSNDILWPIFHYVPLPLFRVESEKKFDFRLWDAYKLANKRFAQAVNQVYRDGDYVWVHDYHLMMLPSLLRKRHPRCKIGWFLHTPFPSAEMYGMMPVGRQILEGLLGADLLGFHTYDYARHFLAASSRIPGASSSPKGIDLEDHFSAIGVFPIGIDPEHFESILHSEETQLRVKELTAKFEGKKIIVGVDRLDYIKGIPHKLLAMERFLAEHPERREDVILIQIAVPSRTSVQEYQFLAASVNEMVGRINGRYGALQHSPVHYIHRSVPPHELVALYNLADVCLVTSIRDGMNLVSHEYVMCQNAPCDHREGPGVLILSEFAGSAQSLSGAIRVNPWNTKDMSSALDYALNLPLMEREYRQTNLYRYVKTHTATFWAKSFMSELEYAVSKPYAMRKLVKLPVMDVINAYSRSKNRIIVLDYEGTLLEEAHQRSRIAPPKPFVKRLIESLSADKKNTVILVSGHERGVISSWVDDRRIGVIAESGYFYRAPYDEAWNTMVSEVDPSWKKVVRPIMQYFTERTPGSYIEAKESSLTWHYGETDCIFGTMQARDMQVNLEDVLCNLPLEVLQGTNRVEVRLQGITKTVIMEEIMQAHMVKTYATMANTTTCYAGPLTSGDISTTISASSSASTLTAAAAVAAGLAAPPPPPTPTPAPAHTTIPGTSTPVVAPPKSTGSDSKSTSGGANGPFPVDFILCAGNGLADEDIFAFFKDYQEILTRQMVETATAIAVAKNLLKNVPTTTTTTGSGASSVVANASSAPSPSTGIHTTHPSPPASTRGLPTAGTPPTSMAAHTSTPPVPPVPPAAPAPAPAPAPPANTTTTTTTTTSSTTGITSGTTGTASSDEDATNLTLNTSSSPSLVAAGAAADATTTTKATTSGSGAAPKRASVFTCHIGSNKTQAMYYLEKPNDLLRVLRALAAHSREGGQLTQDTAAPP